GLEEPRERQWLLREGVGRAATDSEVVLEQRRAKEALRKVPVEARTRDVDGACLEIGSGEVSARGDERDLHARRLAPEARKEARHEQDLDVVGRRDREPRSNLRRVERLSPGR